MSLEQFQVFAEKIEDPILEEWGKLGIIVPFYIMEYDGKFQKLKKRLDNKKVKQWCVGNKSRINALDSMSWEEFKIFAKNLMDPILEEWENVNIKIDFGVLANQKQFNILKNKLKENVLKKTLQKILRGKEITTRNVKDMSSSEFEDWLNKIQDPFIEELPELENYDYSALFILNAQKFNCLKTRLNNEVIKQLLLDKKMSLASFALMTDGEFKVFSCNLEDALLKEWQEAGFDIPYAILCDQQKFQTLKQRYNNTKIKQLCKEQEIDLTCLHLMSSERYEAFIRELEDREIGLLTLEGHEISLPFIEAWKELGFRFYIKELDDEGRFCKLRNEFNSLAITPCSKDQQKIDEMNLIFGINSSSQHLILQVISKNLQDPMVVQLKRKGFEFPWRVLSQKGKFYNLKSRLEDKKVKNFVLQNKDYDHLSSIYLMSGDEFELLKQNLDDPLVVEWLNNGLSIPSFVLEYEEQFNLLKDRYNKEKVKQKCLDREIDLYNLCFMPQEDFEIFEQEIIGDWTVVGE